MSAINCECGLLYSSDSQSDRRRHKREHDEWENGVRSDAPSLQVGRHGEYRITVVPPNAPARLLEVAGRLGRIGNRETRYDGGVYSLYRHPDALREHGVHALLVWHGERAIGILVCDRRSEEVYIRWDDEPGLRLPVQRPRWSVAYAWVHPAHRRKGIGGALFRAAADVGRVAVSELGLLGPFTDEGEALVRKHFPDGFWGI